MGLFKMLLLFTFIAVTSAASIYRTEQFWKWGQQKKLRCGLIRVCKAGNICAGTKKWLQLCAKPMPVGGQCGREAQWICQLGVKCISGICTITVPLGDACSGKGHLWATGTTCDGKICTKTVTLGQRCAVKGLVCDTGTTCDGKICTKTDTLGQRCSTPGRIWQVQHETVQSALYLSVRNIRLWGLFASTVLHVMVQYAQKQFSSTRNVRPRGWFPSLVQHVMVESAQRLSTLGRNAEQRV